MESQELIEATTTKKPITSLKHKRGHPSKKYIL